MAVALVTLGQCVMAVLRLRQQLEGASQPSGAQREEFAVAVFDVARNRLTAEDFGAFVADVKARLGAWWPGWSRRMPRCWRRRRR